jgi:gas vesicle protein
MNANEMLHKVKTLLGVDTDNIEVNLEEVALEQLSLENGTILEADSFSSGEEVFIVTDDEKVALPVGEYELSDNRILIVKTEGMIDEIKNQEEVTENAQDTNLEHTPDHKEDKKEDMAYATREEMTALAEAVEEVKNQLKEVVEKMMEDKEKKEEMAKQETLSKPAVDGIKHTPEVEDTKLGARFAVNSNQNTTYNRVLQAITNNK